MRAWCLTDGTPDLEEACLGVAEAVADRVERRRIAPRAPWRWLAPFGAIDPRDAPERGVGPLAPKRGEGWPDLVVASGAKAAPYLTRVKKASQGRVIAVFIGARGAPAVADVVVALEHERASGPNVVVTQTAAHRVNAVRLGAARGGPAPGALPTADDAPRVGVIIGEGQGRRGLSDEDVTRLLAALRRLKADGARLIVRPPRHAPALQRVALSDAAHYLWDGAGPDPYLAVLAHSEALVVAATSAHVVSEALSTGAPVMVFLPTGAPAELRAFVSRLALRGLVRPFAGVIEPYRYLPVDSTRDVAHAIEAMVATRAVLRSDAPRAALARTPETNGPPSR